MRSNVRVRWRRTLTFSSLISRTSPASVVLNSSTSRVSSAYWRKTLLPVCSRSGVTITSHNPTYLTEGLGSLRCRLTALQAQPPVLSTFLARFHCSAASPVASCISPPPTASAPTTHTPHPAPHRHQSNPDKPQSQTSTDSPPPGDVSPLSVHIPTPSTHFPKA